MGKYIESLFRSHPIRFPLFLALGGFGVFGWIMLDLHTIGYYAVYASGFSFLAGIIGVILLPFGVATVVRRRRNPVVLSCPRCMAVSASSGEPFRVEYLDHVEYAWVVCSQCGENFTVNKYAVLRR